MIGSLRDIQMQNEPNHTLSVIRSSVKSALGDQWMWMVVEDEDDVKVYKKFVQPHKTHVLPSLAENGSKGCKNVETIVTTALAGITQKVVGIRDADYIRFNNSYKIPNQVYCTDERDIEMQMLSSESVQEGLKIWNNAIPDHLDWIYTNVARERGCMRLISDVDGLGCSFKNEATISHLWDAAYGGMQANWQQIMYIEFFKHCKNRKHYTRKEYMNRKQQLNLDNLSTYQLCQGHDVVAMLQYRLHDSAINTDVIMAKMTEMYSLVVFQKTELYHNLKVLQQKLQFLFVMN